MRQQQGNLAGEPADGSRQMADDEWSEGKGPWKGECKVKGNVYPKYEIGNARRCIHACTDEGRGGGGMRYVAVDVW